MTGNLALDTNAVIAYRASVAQVVELIDDLEHVLLPVPVLGELLYGAAVSGKPQQNHEAVVAFARSCTVLQPDAQTAGIYATTRAILKKIGKPLPENDIWIASLCLQWDVPLLTRDAHFAHIQDLTVKTFAVD